MLFSFLCVTEEWKIDAIKNYVRYQELMSGFLAPNHEKKFARRWRQSNQRISFSFSNRRSRAGLRAKRKGSSRVPQIIVVTVRLSKFEKLIIQLLHKSHTTYTACDLSSKIKQYYSPIEAGRYLSITLWIYYKNIFILIHFGDATVNTESSDFWEMFLLPSGHALLAQNRFWQNW